MAGCLLIIAIEDLMSAGCGVPGLEGLLIPQQSRKEFVAAVIYTFCYAHPARIVSWDYVLGVTGAWLAAKPELQTTLGSPLLPGCIHEVEWIEAGWSRRPRHASSGLSAPAKLFSAKLEGDLSVSPVTSPPSPG